MPAAVEGQDLPQPERLKRIIRSEGYTYQTLADEIGITPQAIGSIVHGETKGSTARYAVAKALGYEVEDLWPEGEGVAA